MASPLDFPCPTCDAEVGAFCQINGKPSIPHAVRTQAAKLGVMTGIMLRDARRRSKRLGVRNKAMRRLLKTSRDATPITTLPATVIAPVTRQEEPLVYIKGSCSACGEPGHNRLKCPKRLGGLR
jgi:hypothetical protein